MSVTATAKLKKAQSLNKHLCMLQDLCEEKGYKMRHITSYQVRVNNILDVYPTRLKYCYLPTKEWGQLSTEQFEAKIIKLLCQ